MHDLATQDRAQAVRSALRSLVAKSGLDGAAMSAIAKKAGVATGTAYTYYGSKEDLVIATYLETKEQMGDVALAAADPELPPDERFVALWEAIYSHYMAYPDQAKFLVQIESSPYLEKARAYARSGEKGALTRIVETDDMARSLAPLDPIILYELGIAPAVRLASSGVELRGGELAATAGACWRAISRPT